MSPRPARHVALVPAGGSGSRFGEPVPKQYVALAGRPLLAHTLAALAAHPGVDRIVVVIAPGDAWFDDCMAGALPRATTVLRVGGATRAASVLNGLRALAPELMPRDWVLVHDAVRPCLATAVIDRLLTTLADDDVGGLAALPIADTLKRADGLQRVATTVARAGLWAAQTPQMFRFGMLLDALERCDPATVTDEASAIEAGGHAPRLVPGDPANLKVTYPDDRELAATWLARGRA